MRRLAPLILLCLGLAACGSDTKTETVEQTVTRTTGAPKTAAPPTATTKAPRRVVRLRRFLSPSKNIACAVIGAGARCDIQKRDWKPPPKPASCDVDYGQGLEVGRTGPSGVVCAGDTTIDPSAPALAYGTASRVGAFLCVSEKLGITCTNRASGHGFFLARQRYRLF